YGGADLQFAKYFTNPELALYMDDSKFGTAVPGLAPLRIQTNSLGAFDFRNGMPGLFGLKGTAALNGTALSEAAFGGILLPDNKSPRAVDLLPIFYTGVPNLPPYQLATGKPFGNPLAAGKPFINNFLPTLGDLLRLNMAVPATPRNDPKFSSLGLVQAAVLGITDPMYNGSTALQFIPNMDGFPNGRRLEDDVTTIELQAVGGVVLAALGLFYDDATPAAPVSPNLLRVVTFNAGVTRNDTTLRTSFPYEQHPWRAFRGNQYVGPKASPTSTQPLAATVVSYDCSTGNITFGRVGGDPNRMVEFAAAGVVNGGYGTSVNRQIEQELRKDPNSRRILTVMARYVGDPMSAVSFDFDFRTPCGMMARIGAERTVPMLVRVVGNPTVGDDVTVEVSGAAGQSIRLGITNSQGRLINQQTISEASATERRTLRLGQQPGVYFLQVTTPTERQTVKIIRN
ncbi:MAG TPA: DUF4331 family protein, partial [Hymenobacter sp.]|nr:DUF4331 family protein [Hymenobacter sp.]